MKYSDGMVGRYNFSSMHSCYAVCTEEGRKINVGTYVTLFLQFGLSVV
jgi:hypothetical protein